jgi:PKD repeat protein
VWTDYPYGNGTLATITFKTIYQPSSQQPSITSDLVLNDTLLVSYVNQTEVGTIPYTLTNAQYDIAPLTFTYEPVEPSAGQVTVFNVAEPESHIPVTYDWDFGDGITLSTTEPTVGHAFQSPGDYNVTLTAITSDATASAVETVTVVYYTPLDVTAQVGSLHFKGETAEFTILTTDSGTPVNATSLEAELYFNGTLIEDLSSAVQTVATGLYNVPYYIPAQASAGEYTMLVEAEYYGATGAAIAKFTISPTLSAWNDSMAQITGIQDGVATITNGVATLTLNLASINATLTGLIQSNGQTLATISTSLGTLTTNLNTINAKIGDTNGNNVTIYSTLGDITTKLNGVQSTATTTLYLASALSAIAVIIALAILILLLVKTE